MTSGRTETRPPLTRESILSAAIALVDANGVDQLTMRSLGAALDADPTAFYRHYRDKGELLTAVADHLLGDVLDGFQPDPDWAQTLRDVTARARNIYLTHPHLSSVLGYAPDTLHNNARVHEQVLKALVRSGLPDDDIPVYAAMIGRWVVAGSVYDAMVRIQSGSANADQLTRQMFAALPQDQFPFAVRFAGRMFPEASQSHQVGLEVILDSITHRVAHSSHDLEKRNA